MKSILPGFLFLQSFLFLRGQCYLAKVGRHIAPYKVEVDFNLLCGILTSFAVTLMDKDFLDKLIEHGSGQGLKALVFINQGNEPLR